MPNRKMYYDVVMMCGVILLALEQRKCLAVKGLENSFSYSDYYSVTDEKITQRRRSNSCLAMAIKNKACSFSRPVDCRPNK